jgi:hypothetical protein
MLATILFVLSPTCLTLAQRARPYPVQSMLAALAFWGFVHICLDETARSQPIGTGLRSAFRRPSSDTAWLTYAICGALAMLTQQPAGFFILGCNVAMAVLIMRDWHANRRWLINWIIAQLILVAIWAIWLPSMLQQFAAHLTPAQIETKHAIFLVNFEQVAGTIGSLFSISGLWRLAAHSRAGWRHARSWAGRCRSPAAACPCRWWACPCKCPAPARGCLGRCCRAWVATGTCWQPAAAWRSCWRRGWQRRGRWCWTLRL